MFRESDVKCGVFGAFTVPYEFIVSRRLYMFKGVLLKCSTEYYTQLLNFYFVAHYVILSNYYIAEELIFEGRMK